MTGRSIHKSLFLTGASLGWLLFWSSPAAAQLASIRDAFDHKAHKTVTCQLCHEREDGKGALKVFTALDCNGCHHATTNEKRCAACHSAGELKPFTRDVVVKTSVAKAATTRALTFAHATHGKLGCSSCHSNKTKLGSVPSCSSCHDTHHTAARNCASCHSNVKGIKQHTREAHVTCSGSGCHKTTVTNALRTERNACLACHTDKLNHETDGDCATCHLFTKKSNARAAQ